MGLVVFASIVVFTLLSAFLGVGLGLLVQPGLGIDIGTTASTAQIADTSITKTLVGFVPTNIFSSMASGAMVPCILFSIFFGACTGIYQRDHHTTIVTDFLTAVNGVILEIIKAVMKVAPIGIFCLLANVAGGTGFAVIMPMLKFLGCLLIGDVIQFLVYCPAVAAICGVNPMRMPSKYGKMSMMALTTTSSAICLPTKMEDMVTKFGVDRKVTDFVGPITMSMNSCGAVQCYVLAILFMSQSTGITLSPMQFGMAILLAVLMCMGTIVVPGGMIVVYTFFATTMGLPTESVAILIGIDWFSGMFRTLMNVDVDVLVGMLTSKALGVFNKGVYNDETAASYIDAITNPGPTCGKSGKIKENRNG